MRVSNKKYDYYEHIKINNLRELIELRLDNTPDDIAFSYKDDGKVVKKTYQEVYYDVENLSAYFYKKYKNKHIALIGENSYFWVITFLAIILSGNVCVAIDKDLNEKDINNLIKKADVSVIFHSNKYCNFIKDIWHKAMPLESTLEYINQGKSLINKHKADVSSTAAIFFTSGTTGANKAVMLSEYNIASDIYGASSLYKPEGKVVSILPFHHAFGLITSVLKPFYYGKEVFISSSLKYALNDFKEIQPETLFLVPAFIETFYKKIWKNVRKENREKKLKRAISLSNNLRKLNIDLRAKFFKNILSEFGGNVKYIICGGAYLDKKYVKWFRSIGIEILNGYGITECSPVVSVNRNFHHKDGSIGQVCRDVEVKIIDGEICVKGPIVMLGYYKDKKATQEVMQDGYFHTGDLGYMDKDGFLFITGRKKNIIILSNGENISPELIEAELLKNKAIAEVVVYAEAGRIVASIYPVEEYLGDQKFFDIIISKYNKDKPINKQISLVKLRNEEFVKNNNGKIMRNKIMEENHER